MILFYPVNLYDSSSYVPSFTLNIFCFLFPGFQKVFLCHPFQTGDFGFIDPI